MATPFPFPLSATQVGTYFVGQYYHVLETKPELVYQFYSDASTMIRIDGNARDTATAMLQIHALIMSISFTGIGIKTVQCLESWSGGVLISVFGSAQLKDYNVRRKFMQLFFLAPQEKGFFVLNDIFHFVDEEPVHNLQPVFLAQSNFDSKLNATSTINKPVSNYLLGGDIQARDFVARNEVKENGAVNTYGFSQQQIAQVHESEHVQEDVIIEESHGFFQPSVNDVQELAPSSAEEPPEEPLKHTYASILQVAKGQVTLSVASQPSLKKAPSLDKEHSTPTNSQQTPTFTKAFERSEIDIAEDIPTADDEDEIKSVYVRNLSPTVSASEIEEELKNFGRIRPNGVVIRSRKDVGVCYAFVEFEDMNGVHNAVKAGSVEVAGRQVYIEERRPNSNIPSRGGRRGRGRSSYQSEAQIGRFGPRSYGRGNGQDGGEREYNKTRGNAFYRPTTRQESGY
ncbi:nuclear transport factor 2-like isoform X1 [Vigna umbellata]|uniref:nuclear transport factor 2-like isoform X1 n=2 Tax=Vigna umbellata TaxID=87088 RepID=UPI001F5FCDC4|nr:nuclear transport factor 2-like isoform X1 [Vigna umbellata]XP_047168737.1 nuclear transport factor 2-like isoform X1 [Vigna umbellata]XP_047168738.1 nuclear transport factor 2-like isoform X1 [Vigna umbellata]